jgi:uncharacterized protein (TIGR02588 family)
VTDEADRHADAGTQSGTSTVEWIVAGLGALIVAGTIGAMIFFGFHQAGRAPLVTLYAERIEAAGDRYMVAFVARNTGDSTASTLQVVGVLADGDSPVETSETTIDHLPAHSERRGGLFFTRDPGRHALRLHAGGYVSP